MCGLIGYSGSKDFNIEKIKLLMFWNFVERGKDSTGIYTPKTGLIKDDKDAGVFLADKTNNILTDTLLIGHVRQGTRGLKSKENAHPYQYGKVIGAHNGTIKNDGELCRKYGMEWSAYQTDSQVIFAALDKHNSVRVFYDLEGAGAFIFAHEDEPGKLYIIRNSERPLFRGKAEEGTYFSSIQPSLQAIGCSDVMEIKESCLYTFKDGAVVEHRKLKMKPVVVPATYTSRNNYGYNAGNTYEQSYADPILYPTTPHELKYWEKRWLVCDSPTRTGDKVVVTVGKWYFVEEAKDLDLLCVDDTGLKVCIPKMKFDFRNSRVTQGGHVVATRQVFDSAAKSLIDKDEVVKLTLLNKVSGTVSTEDSIGFSVIDVPLAWIRPASDSEIKKFEKEVEDFLNAGSESEEYDIEEKREELRKHIDFLDEVIEDFKGQAFIKHYTQADNNFALEKLTSLAVFLKEFIKEEPVNESTSTAVDEKVTENI